MLKIINLEQKKEILKRISFFYLPITIALIYSISVSWSVQSAFYAPANHEILSYLTWGIFSLSLYFIGNKKIIISTPLLLALLILFVLNEFSSSFYKSDDRLILFIYLSNIIIYHSIVSSFIENNPHGLEIVEKTVFLSLAINGVCISAIILIQWITYGDPVSDINNWILPSNSNRFSANIGQPNHAATFSCLGISAIYYFYNKSNKTKILLLVPLLVFSIFLTGSRTGIIAVAAICLLHISKYKKTLKNLLINSFPAIILIILIILRKEFESGSIHEPNGLESGRYLIYKIAIDLIQESPFWGYGFNNITPTFIEHITKYPEYSEQSSLSSFHNFFLDASIQFGLVAGVFLFVIYSWQYIKIYINQNPCVTSSILIISIHALLEFPLSYTYFIFPFITLFCISTKSRNFLELNSNFRKIIFYSVLITSIISTSLLILTYSNANLEYKRIRLQYLGVAIRTKYTENKECFIQSVCDYLNSHLHVISKNPPELPLNLVEVFKKYPTPYTLNLYIKKSNETSNVSSNHETIRCAIFSKKYCNEK